MCYCMLTEYGCGHPATKWVSVHKDREATHEECAEYHFFRTMKIGEKCERCTGAAKKKEVKDKGKDKAADQTKKATDGKRTKKASIEIEGMARDMETGRLERKGKGRANDTKKGEDKRRPPKKPDQKAKKPDEKCTVQ